MTTPAAPVRKGLTLLDSTMLIMGTMIGSGIFIVSAGIAREVQTPGMLLLAWVVTGIMTIFGALSYGELAAAMPKAGGQYVYLKAAYSRLFGFLYGWTLFTVIQTGTIAAVAVAFARFTGVFFQAISATDYLFTLGSFHISTEQLLAIACISFLSLLNFRKVEAGALVQNLLSFAKITALLGVIAVGVFAGLGGKGSSLHFTPAWPTSFTVGTWGIFLAAMVGSLFSSDAWNNVTFTAGEVIRPQRNLPLSLAIGTGAVTLLYLGANFIYLYILPLQSIATAPGDRVGTLLMERVLGNVGLYVMAVIVMVSTFGCVNGCILSGARVYYAMALDGLFFKPAAKLNRNGVPANSLLFQGAWACILTLSGSYANLLDYVIFAVLLFYILTVLGLFVLRRTQPAMARPYRALGYPVVPVIYILLALAVCISQLIYKPDYSYSGLGIVLLGIPVYYFIGRNHNAQAALKGEPLMPPQA